ncbi:OsmC family protein [Mycobacterium sp. NPDC003449]
MLWYLALCARDGITATVYRDYPVGTMAETAEGGGSFVDVTLRPRVTITSADRVDDADTLHHEAHRMCFIDNSVNFPVNAEPTTSVAQSARGDTW